MTPNQPLELKVPYCPTIYADRDGVQNDNKREGFYIILRDLRIHFEDEADALHLAQRIASRLGCYVRGNVGP